ncbi:MAG: hypothetical protein PUF12_06355 [Thermoflexaceae bacterium]|nr:hypothetical protein [Thermoflexaceae bacterium]
MGKSSTDSISSVVRTVINISINILVVAIVMMLIYTYAGKAYEFGKEIFDDTAIDTTENARSVVVTIPKNASNSDVAGIIAKAGLVENKNVFLIQLMLSEYKDEVVPGTYTLSTADTPTEIMIEICKMTEDAEEDEKK